MKGVKDEKSAEGEKGAKSGAKGTRGVKADVKGEKDQTLCTPSRPLHHFSSSILGKTESFLQQQAQPPS